MWKNTISLSRWALPHAAWNFTFKPFFPRRGFLWVIEKMCPQHNYALFPLLKRCIVNFRCEDWVRSWMTVAEEKQAFPKSFGIAVAFWRKHGRAFHISGQLSISYTRKFSVFQLFLLICLGCLRLVLSASPSRSFAPTSVCMCHPAHYMTHIHSAAAASIRGGE